MMHIETFMLSYMSGIFYWADVARADASKSLIDRISSVLSDGIPFATPISSLRTNEVDLVSSFLGLLILTVIFYPYNHMLPHLLLSSISTLCDLGTRCFTNITRFLQFSVLLGPCWREFPG